MNHSEKDTLLAFGTNKLMKFRLVFLDKDGNKVYESPEAVFKEVNSMIEKNEKVVMDTVGRLGEMLVGGFPPGPSRQFMIGWYMYKFISIYKDKKGYTEFKIESEEETLTKEKLSHILGDMAIKQGEKYKKLGEDVMRNGIPDDIMPN